MKTQIITLESHDDLISVRDKLSWTKTSRVLLVWPKYEKIALRLLDLKVLQRHASSLGAQLGLVTLRANVRRDAESLGIPVFDSTASAQKEQWTQPAMKEKREKKPPRRDLRSVRETVYMEEPAWRTSLIGRVISFSVGVIAFIVVVGLFIPKTVVTIYPITKEQSAIIPVAAGELYDSVSVAGNVPARKITVVVDAEQTLAIASEIDAPKSKSKGVARFTNLSQDEVRVPLGTVVSTESGVRFITLHDTRLPVSADQFVDVPIEAVNAGENGNVQAEMIVVVEGPLGLVLTVTNPNPASGGANVIVIGPSEDDRAALRASMIENLQRDAETKLRAQIAPSDLLLMDTLELSKILEESFDPPMGSAGMILKLKMQVEYSVRYVSSDDLRQLSFAAMDASVEDSYQPYDNLSFKPLTDPSTDSVGVTHFEIDVRRTLFRSVDKAQVVSIARGQAPENLKTKLMLSLLLPKEPEIAISPAWWPWTSLIPINISVEVK